MPRGRCRPITFGVDKLIRLRIPPTSDEERDLAHESTSKRTHAYLCRHAQAPAQGGQFYSGMFEKIHKEKEVAKGPRARVPNVCLVVAASVGPLGLSSREQECIR